MSRQPKRPLLVTLLAASVLILTVYNAVRVGTAIVQWDLLLKLMPLPGPLYVAVTGLFWTFGLLIATLNLWFGWKWVPLSTALILFFYSTYYWFDRLLFQLSQPRVNWFFALLLTIVYLLFAALALALPGSRKFFNRQKRVL